MKLDGQWTTEYAPGISGREPSELDATDDLTGAQRTVNEHSQHRADGTLTGGYDCIFTRQVFHSGWQPLPESEDGK